MKLKSWSVQNDCQVLYKADDVKVCQYKIIVKFDKADVKLVSNLLSAPTEFSQSHINV